MSFPNDNNPPFIGCFARKQIGIITQATPIWHHTPPNVGLICDVKLINKIKKDNKKRTLVDQVKIIDAEN